MPTIVVAQRMWQRNDTAANWTAKNPVLAEGEVGVELGATTSDPQKVKIGNGVTAWTSLPYHGGGGDRNTVTALAVVSGVVTIDWSLGDYFTLALTANVTSWVITNGPGSGKGFTVMVEITQGASSYTVAKPGTMPGTPASLGVSTTNGAKDLLAITSFNNGTTLRSNINKAYG